MNKVQPKKYLGQHFLHNQDVAKRIVSALKHSGSYPNLIEVGPGMGVLTRYLLQDERFRLVAVDLDAESVDYLKREFSDFPDVFVHQDFLKADLHKVVGNSFGIIGNFPYNISSQIFFKLLEYTDEVQEVVGMVQKEVAERISSPPGNKTYGILSVLLQTYFDIEYLFTVNPGSFTPPPKVKSGVIRLERNDRQALPCSKANYFRVVKAAFQMRRKVLYNALKPINLPPLESSEDLLRKRAEQLSVEEFIELTREIELAWKS